MKSTHCSLAAATLLVSSFLAAEEGMWTFDNFPLDRVESAYGLQLDQAWLDRVRRGSVRLTSGCSAALVSAEGLVQTNHHCVVNCVQNFSTSEEDMVRTGFMTASREEERRCPGVAAEVLDNITDITADINAATAGASGESFIDARDAAIAGIEARCQQEAADRRCEVVSLYQGGQYKLYDYKRYNDVRLVFAPEIDAAFFGGDPDNFNFPRYAFDIAFLRLYENDRPVATPSHLSWRTTPLEPGEPVFVSGNPGSTSRLSTTTQMAFTRDHFLPWRLVTLSELRGRLSAYSSLGSEQARIAADTLFGVENTIKAFNGERLALVDPAVFDLQTTAEAELQAQVAADPALAREVDGAWDEIAQAVARYRGFYLQHQYVEQRAGGGSALFSYAKSLIRAAAEREKPDAERLAEYSRARLPSLQQELFAEAPVEAPLEDILLGFWLAKMREYLGTDDPLTHLVLDDQAPENLARNLVAGSTLGDPEVRRHLYEGGSEAIMASEDPMIRFVLRFDPEARALRSRYEREVTGPTTRAQERIARARFAVFGDSVYPDATFTLRLSYGSIQGWTEPSGREVEPFTRIGGLYQRATGAPPYALTASWQQAQDALDPTTIFNVTSTNDIIGGNSGSPLLDGEGHVVGAVFDGNIHSLGGDYVFDMRLNRTISVATTVAGEALLKVYGRQALVDELLGR